MAGCIVNTEPKLKQESTIVKQEFLYMDEYSQVDNSSTRYRKCLDSDKYCSQSGKSRLCTRQMMFFHVLKIPTKRMVKIVEKYNLTKYPLALGRYTLANLITDYTKQDFADELMKGENQ